MWRVGVVFKFVTYEARDGDSTLFTRTASLSTRVTHLALAHARFTILPLSSGLRPTAGLSVTNVNINGNN